MRSMYAMSYPAAMGGVVTQGHADYCRDNGHAGWTEGEAGNIRHVGICPRCGEPTATPAADNNEEHDMPDMHDDAPDDIPQVWDNAELGTITIEDAEGAAITFPRTEARDLARTLLAMTEGDPE